MSVASWMHVSLTRATSREQELTNALLRLMEDFAAQSSYVPPTRH